MLKASLKKPRRKPLIGKLKDKIGDIDGEYVEAGYWASQGEHPTAEMSFVDLITIHEHGLFDITQRMPMAHIGQYASDRLSSSYKEFTRRYLESRQQAATYLDKFGREINEAAYEVFGNSPPLQITNNPTPLVDTGELSDAFSWKSSKSSSLKSLPDRNSSGSNQRARNR